MTSLRLRARAGMTLMELTVTLAITGMLTAVGAAAFSGIIEHHRVLNESNVATERAAALRDVIQTWITAGTIQTQSGGTPGGAGAARGGSVVIRANPNAPAGVNPAVATGDEITFTTSALTPANAPTTRIRMFIDGDDNTPEYGLTIEYQGLSGNTTTQLQRRQLDPTIGAMTVEFLDSRTHQWIESTQVATAITPTAARITFLPIDSTNVDYALTPLLRLPFVFRMGNAQAASTTPGR